MLSKKDPEVLRRQLRDGGDSGGMVQREYDRPVGPIKYGPFANRPGSAEQPGRAFVARPGPHSGLGTPTLE